MHGYGSFKTDMSFTAMLFVTLDVTIALKFNNLMWECELSISQNGDLYRTFPLKTSRVFFLLEFVVSTRRGRHVAKYEPQHGTVSEKKIHEETPAWRKNAIRKITFGGPWGFSFPTRRKEVTTKTKAWTEGQVCRRANSTRAHKI